MNNIDIKQEYEHRTWLSRWHKSFLMWSLHIHGTSEPFIQWCCNSTAVYLKFIWNATLRKLKDTANLETPSSNCVISSSTKCYQFNLISIICRLCNFFFFLILLYGLKYGALVETCLKKLVFTCIKLSIYVIL